MEYIKQILCLQVITSIILMFVRVYITRDERSTEVTFGFNVKCIVVQPL